MNSAIYRLLHAAQNFKNHSALPVAPKSEQPPASPTTAAVGDAYDLQREVAGQKFFAKPIVSAVADAVNTGSQVEVVIRDSVTGSVETLYIPANFPLTVGSGTDNMVVLNDASVASRHASIDRLGRHTVATIVDQPCTRIDEQEIQIGRFGVRFFY